MKPSQTYLLNELSKYTAPAVLDFACSTGALWDHIPKHVAMYGCDIVLSPEMAERIRGREDRFHLSADPAKIPFPDGMFDIVFANSAFEHVHPIREIIDECARVLKPGGRLLAIVPCKTVLMEPHFHIPFASWLPPGKIRRFWCELWSGRGDRAEQYLVQNTNYLRSSKYRAMLQRHFRLNDITGELMRLSGHRPAPSWIVSRFYAAAFDAVRL